MGRQKGKSKYETPMAFHEAVKASKRKYWRNVAGTNSERIERVEKLVKKNTELVKNNEARIDNIERDIGKMKWGAFKEELDSRKPEPIKNKQAAVNPSGDNPSKGTNNSDGAPLALKPKAKKIEMNLFSKEVQDE